MAVWCDLRFNSALFFWMCVVAPLELTSEPTRLPLGGRKFPANHIPTQPTDRPSCQSRCMATFWRPNNNCLKKEKKKEKTKSAPANTSMSFWSAHVLCDIIEREEFMNYTVAHHRDEILLLRCWGAVMSFTVEYGCVVVIQLFVFIV